MWFPTTSPRRKAAPLALALLAPYLVAACATAQSGAPATAAASAPPPPPPLTLNIYTAHPIARDEVTIVPLDRSRSAASARALGGQVQSVNARAAGRPAGLPAQTQAPRPPAEPTATLSVDRSDGSGLGLLYRGEVYPLEFDPRGAPVLDVYLAPDRRNAVAMGGGPQPGAARIEQWATITWGPGDRALDVLVDGVVQGRTTITRSVRPGRRTFEWRSGSLRVCQQTLGVLPNMQATLVCGADGLVRRTP